MSLSTLANQIENRIAQALIHEILVRGFTVSINDGEEEVITKSTAEKAILKAMANTDENTIVFFNSKGPVGGIMIFFGEGDEMISDYSDNLITNQIVERAKKIALK